MKRELVSICSLLLFLGAANAESYEATYNKLPNLSKEQLAKPASNEAAISSAQKQYKAATEAVGNEQMSQNKRREAAQKATIKTAEKNKPTKAQMQASQAIGNDMMSALAEAGISPEKMAQMSEEELMAVLMPVIAKKNGLTPEEMKAMQGMSDKEAEAYMKKGTRAKRVQNSEYAQYSQPMNGMGKGIEISDADNAKIDKIIQLDEQIENDENNVSSTIQTTFSRLNKVEFAEEMDKLFNQTYSPRIDAILKELYARVEKEKGATNVGGNGVKMPAYGKDYYAKVNAIVDEYNQEVVNRWEAKLSKEITAIQNELKQKFPLCAEMEKTYDSLSSEEAKSVAAQKMSQTNVYLLMSYYIKLLESRLEAPTRQYYEMPTHIGGMG